MPAPEINTVRLVMTRSLSSRRRAYRPSGQGRRYRQLTRFQIWSSSVGSYAVSVTHTGDRLPEPPGRQARAARILDVAAELLLRHGYRRVTIDDVARGADVGKGTVYLHWKTRDDLFQAVFEREVLQALEE